MEKSTRNVQRLPPEVNRALYVRNLPYKITAEEMYELFGKYGPVRQIRIGDAKDTKGTAFVVYEDIFDAQAAVDSLSGFNVLGRYLVVLYYQQTKFTKKISSSSAGDSNNEAISDEALDTAQLQATKDYFAAQEEKAIR